MKALWTAVFVCTLAAGPAAQSKAPPKGRTRVAFVSVTDSSGPVLTLGPADFDVTESGAKRQVVRASLATTPMRVALIVDTSDGLAAAALNHLRAGLLALVDELSPDDEVMLVSTGRQTRVRVQPTIDRKKIKDAAGGLFADGGATVLTDTLLDVDDRFMRKADNRWPVFVVVTGDGTEGSAGANEKKFNEWIVALPTRPVEAHAIALKFRGGGMPEIVASHVAQAGGGIYEFMNTSNALPDKMKAIGARLAADRRAMSTKYEIEYLTDSADQKPIDVGVAKSGVTIQLSFRRPLR